MISRCFKHSTFIVHFASNLKTATDMIGGADPEVGGPCFEGSIPSYQVLKGRFGL